MEYRYDCRWFNGYKPCHHKRACQDCPHYSPVGKRLAIVSLEAMGAVLRSTCLLPAIRRKYGADAHITWITLPSAKALLDNNPNIDRLLCVGPTTAALWQHLAFDVVFAVDKSLEAGALAEVLQAPQKYGFGLSPSGVIRPLNPEAAYQYQVGLDDELKFHRNTKAETEQLTATMGLPWQRDPYSLVLTPQEQSLSSERRAAVLTSHGRLAPARGVIGYNTGCSVLFPYKKFTVSRAVETIAMWRQTFPDYAVALLGGPEDFQRQQAMKEAFADDPRVVNTPCQDGLRSGVVWMDTADVVLSGCSLGMHIAIALQKHVIAWFGVSCIQEVDLYDRGVKLQAAVSCSPCWRKSCDREPKCYDAVPLPAIAEATARLLQRLS